MRKIENPYLFLKFEEEMMKMVDFLRETRWVCERDEQTRQWTVKMNEGKLKSFLKIILKVQNMWLSRLKWVTNKSLDQVAKKPLRQNLKILSKCFSWLEGPHVRKSQRELRNFLSIPRDWSFHSQTSRQTELQGI